MRLRGNVWRRIGPVGFQLSNPRANRAPLVVRSGYGRIAPLHRHARGDGRPLRPRGNIAQGERRCVFEFPTPVAGSHFNRQHRFEVVPGLRVSTAWGQIDFQSLENYGNAFLNLPDVLVNIWFEDLFGFADDGSAHIDRGRMRDAQLVGRQHDGYAGVALLNEIAVLGLVRLLVGCDGPHAEVVDLFVFTVANAAGHLAAALR